jgi:peptide/nickel transport system permease protein
VHQYILRRLLLMIPTLFGVSVIVFALVRMLPGDAVTMLLQEFNYAKDAEELRAKLGLDRPAPVQYVEWLGGVTRGDFGVSLRSKNVVGEEIMNKLPVTLELGVLALIFGLLIAVPIGVLAAVRQDTAADYVARSTAIGFLAIPGFWLGTLVITLPSVWWQWAPPLRYTPLWQDPGRNLAHVVIPAVILGLALSGALMRLTRTQMLEVLRQDFVRTAQAKGLAERAVVFRHALKNAFIPILTLFGLQISILISGTVVLESIFNLPGMGRYLLEGIQYRDYPIIQAINLIFAAVIVLANLVVDLLYAWLDPRVRYR